MLIVQVGFYIKPDSSTIVISDTIPFSLPCGFQPMYCNRHHPRNVFEWWKKDNKKAANQALKNLFPGSTFTKLLD